MKFLPFFSKNLTQKKNRKIQMFVFQQIKILVFLNIVYKKRTTFAVYYFTNTVIH